MEDEKMESVFVVITSGKNIRRIARIIGVVGRYERKYEKIKKELCLYYKIKYTDGKKETDIIAMGHPLHNFPPSYNILMETEANKFVQFCKDAELLRLPANSQ